MIEVVQHSSNPLVNGNLRISVLDAGLIRIEYAPDGVFNDLPSLAVSCQDTSFNDFSVEQTARSVAVITSMVKVVYYPAYGVPRNGVLDFFIDGEYHSFGEENLGNLGSCRDSLDGVRSKCSLNDGVISTSGWYCLHDTSPLLDDSGALQARPADKDRIDCYLFVYKHDYRRALQLLAKLTGLPALPPRQMFGAWYSRWEAYSSEDFRKIAEAYRRYRLPLDVLVMDMDWHRLDADYGHGWGGTLGWTGWSWNRELLPDAEQLISEMHRQGTLTALNIHPHDGIRKHEDCYEDFQRHYPGHDGHFALEDPEYVQAFFACAHEPLCQAGCDIFWVDWQQDMLFPEVPDIGGKVLLQLNYAYAEFYHKKKLKPMLLSRWGGWGDQRSGMKFSGDVSAAWESLAFEILYTILAGNAGNCFLSHDLGGFSGNCNAELFVRWLQFGALSCAMRIHSSCSVPERLPWEYAEPFRSAIFSAYRLHERLSGEIYSAAIECSQTALPVIRGMYLMHPEDIDSVNHPYQYYLGDHILAAPVVAPCTENFPAKTTIKIFDDEWFDPWQQHSYAPGEYILERKLSEPAMLVRCGVPLMLDRHGVGNDIFVALPSKDGVYTNIVKNSAAPASGSPITVRQLQLTRCGNDFTLEIPAMHAGGNLLLARCKKLSCPGRIHYAGNYAMLRLPPSPEPQTIHFTASVSDDRAPDAMNWAAKNHSITPGHPSWHLVIAPGSENGAKITLQRNGLQCYTLQVSAAAGELLHLPLPGKAEQIQIETPKKILLVKRENDELLFFEKSDNEILLNGRCTIWS